MLGSETMEDTLQDVTSTGVKLMLLERPTFNVRPSLFPFLIASAIQTASEAAICSGVAAGHGIIANVNGGSHWVLITGCAGNGVFYVNDPGFNRNTYSFHEILREAVYH